MERYAFVVEGAEMIAHMIGRYAIFEDLYLRRKSTATDELRAALVQLYAAIMIYLVRARSYFEQNSFSESIVSIRSWTGV